MAHLPMNPLSDTCIKAVGDTPDDAPIAVLAGPPLPALAPRHPPRPQARCAMGAMEVGSADPYTHGML